MSKKKNEALEEDEEVKDDDADEEAETEEVEQEQNDFENEEDYLTYLSNQKARIDGEIKRLEDKKSTDAYLLNLPEKISDIEDAISELQNTVKILWSEKKR